MDEIITNVNGYITTNVYGDGAASNSSIARFPYTAMSNQGIARIV